MAMHSPACSTVEGLSEASRGLLISSDPDPTGCARKAAGGDPHSFRRIAFIRECLDRKTSAEI